ncbi:hypothetical protein SAMD00019534_082200 [Acytostelium subglobosum LB1]|uniref:hypothetical protein n=1 Tax=Acytostelium subglobosum LB1 TaxID=1410327 RepID=UPI000644A7AA|nr:hypothetical protein SAMD00019534_082200 [Acytostelium subglobosum LB1]GAM25045.1 hypothetical protein SAMD00019534_082200 [Acytostelium subglobosum LB1]|eukprot:XP_012752134.1 hypothetical protein SAMD00019534_082200 [Acytostelium subglobosum LB1]
MGTQHPNLNDSKEDLWQRLKRHCKEMQANAQNELNITNFYAELHTYMMAEEHKVKRPVITEKEFIERSMTLLIERLRTMMLLQENMDDNTPIASLISLKIDENDMKEMVDSIETCQTLEEFSATHGKKLLASAHPDGADVQPLSKEQRDLQLLFLMHRYTLDCKEKVERTGQRFNVIFLEETLKSIKQQLRLGHAPTDGDTGESNVRFRRTIESFPRQTRAKIETEPFRCGGVEWYLEVYPKGNQYSNYLAVFLCSRRPHEVPMEVKFSVGIVDQETNGVVLLRRCVDTTNTTTATRVGWEQFVNLGHIWKKIDSLVKDGNLVIDVRITSLEP